MPGLSLEATMASIELVTEPAAIIDDLGDVLATNSAWDRFSEENGGQAEATGDDKEHGPEPVREEGRTTGDGVGGQAVRYPRGPAATALGHGYGRPGGVGQTVQDSHPKMTSVGRWLVAAGVLVSIRAGMEQGDPVSWSPTTAFDYAAAVTTSVAWMVLAVALVWLWRTTPIRRGATLVAAASGGGGFAVAAIGNFREDVVGIQFAQWLFLVGLLGAALALVVAGIAALSVDDPLRWPACCSSSTWRGVSPPTSGVTSSAARAFSLLGVGCS